MSSLHRVVGLGGAVFLGMGSIVGTGAFVSLGLAAEPAGSWLPAAIGVAGIVATFNGLASAQLAAAFPVSGGTYEYGYRCLSPFWGRAAGAGFLLAKTTSASTAALGLASYLGVPAVSLVGTGVVVLVCGAILSGLRRTQWINAALVTVSITALVLFIGFGWGEARPVGGTFPGIGGVMEGAALVFVAFTGYGRLATLGEEVVDPSRNIPRAVIVTLFAALSLYLGVAWVALGLAGEMGFYRGAVEGSPLQTLAHGRLPGVVEVCLRIGAVTAMVGVVLNLILGLSRVVLAMGRRGDLPAFFARVSPGGTPVAAVVGITVGVALGTLLGSISYNWGLSAVSVLGYYAITHAAALTLPEPRFPRWMCWAGLLSCLALSVAIRSGTFLTALGFWGLGVGVLAAHHRWFSRPASQ